MSFAGMLVHDVTIIAPGAMVDRYGDTIANWNSPTTTATKAWIYQRRRHRRRPRRTNPELACLPPR
jgi:hypothetical protein